MIETSLRRLALRRKLNQLLMLVPSRCNPPAGYPALEPEGLQNTGNHKETGTPNLTTLLTELVLLISQIIPH